MEAREKRRKALIMAKKERARACAFVLRENLRARLARIYPDHVISFYTIRTRIMKLRTFFAQYARQDGTIAISDILDLKKDRAPFELPAERLQAWRNEKVPFITFVHVLHPKLSTAFLEHMVHTQDHVEARMLHGLIKSEQIPNIEVDYEGMDELQKLWGIYTRRSQGKLSCQKLEVELRHTGLDPKDLSSSISLYDGDNDGLLDYDEFLGMMASTGVWGDGERDRIEAEKRHARNREQGLRPRRSSAMRAQQLENAKRALSTA